MFNPYIEGEFAIQSPPARFFEAFQQRVQVGLLTGQPGRRSNYQVVDLSSGGLRVRAGDLWTAINVGLNDVELRCSPDGMLQYQVWYWRWTLYCVALGATLGFMGILLFVGMDLRNYIANNPAARLPGFSADQTYYFAWGNLLFWGFLWPWILVALHRRSLRCLLARIVSETDNQAIADNRVTE